MVNVKNYKLITVIIITTIITSCISLQRSTNMFLRQSRTLLGPSDYEGKGEDKRIYTDVLVT